MQPENPKRQAARWMMNECRRYLAEKAGIHEVDRAVAAWMTARAKDIDAADRQAALKAPAAKEKV
jgi:aspartate/methionine/tyrosine aminotransferase